MDKKKATSKSSPKKKSTRDMLTKKQHITMISALRGNNKGLTSLDFRYQYSIIDPPARICELKRKGYQFYITYNTEYDHAGQPHERVARYFLISEPKEVAA